MTSTTAKLLKKTKDLEQAASNRKQEEKEQHDIFEQSELPFTSILSPEEGPTTKYPTLFTRIPIFSPVRNRTLLDTDWVNGDEYETGWGKIKRFGPGLDIYDDDTLLALFRLARQKELIAKRKELPVPVLRVVEDDIGERKEGAEEKAVVQLGTTSAYEVNTFLGRETGGSDLKACRESIQRLSLTSLIIYNDELNKDGKTGFFDYIGSRDFKGTITVQFRPVMVKLLESYTYLDVEVRKELSDVGKSVHKFLSSQRTHYKIGLEKLKNIVRYSGTMGDFKRALLGTKKQKGQLEKMKDKGWLKDYDITGTGRKVPFMLEIKR